MIFDVGKCQEHELPTSHSAMVIRAAEERDLPEIVAIYAADEVRGCREKAEDPLPERYLAAFREITADGNQRLYVAEIDGSLAGTLQLTFIRHLISQGFRRGVIEAMFVAPAWQGRGVGSALLAHAETEARIQSCSSLELTSNKKRARAHCFYERRGFIATHEGFKFTLRY